MQLVDRKTFLTLPAGTVYTKYMAHDNGDIAIKQGTVGDNDWTYTPLDTICFIDVQDADDLFDKLEELKPDDVIDTCMATSYRDGLFQEDAQFLVYSQDDVKKLIELLTHALASTTNK